MRESFQYVLDNYSELGNTVDSTTEVYNKICRVLPKEISDFVDDEKYLVTGSVGQGNLTKFPWVAVMNKNITTTATQGLYVVFLFKSDMSGFYLSLNQGITNFKNLYGTQKYDNAQKVADYFRSEIEEVTFSEPNISLVSEKREIGYGYERANILAKYYASNNFNDEILKADLAEIIGIYELIVDHMQTRSYSDIITEVIADPNRDMMPAAKAIEDIKSAVDPDEDLPFGFIRNMQEVTPFIDKSNKFARLTNPKTGKIDYLKKAKKDAKYGLIGEHLVLQYEQSRLRDAGFSDLAEKVNWVSQEDDSYGYDIESFNINDPQNIKHLFIEVKTTTSKVDTEFFVSKNELEKSRKLNKDYCVFRVYDVTAQCPKFYRAYGKIDDNFILDPVTFKARYKSPEVR